MIITLANGKGGSGKTTLAVLLAHALAESGKAVSVLDLDPQGTATNWLRESGSKVAMYDPARKYEAVFIDTPPRVEALPRALASCSVAVLVCSPSPADLWTTRDTAAAIRPHRDGQQEKDHRDLSTVPEQIVTTALKRSDKTHGLKMLGRQN